MPRARERDIYARTLDQGARTDLRYVDLCVEFVDERDLEPILAVGDRWDRKKKEWADAPATKHLQIQVHKGQIESTEFFANWLDARLGGAPLDQPIYSFMLLGGTRSGKTYLGLRFALAFAVAVPRSRVWLVQEVDIERSDELEKEFDELAPVGWFKKSGGEWTCVNGSVVTIRSGKYPHKLKKGRCDFALVNEGQNMKRDALLRCVERTSDTSGITCIAANPPNDNPEGEWVAEYKEQCAAGRLPEARCFHYVYSDNPHVNAEQLASLEKMHDPRSYKIEVLGETMQPINAVYHAFDLVQNIRPPSGKDCTTEFAKRRGLGDGVTHFVGQDYQRAPHMAAVIAKAHGNPDNPFFHYIGSLAVEYGDEDDLAVAMHAWGLNPKTTAIVGDASGEFQRGDRDKPGVSFGLMRAAGWRRIFVPDSELKRNPLIDERIKNDNRLFTSQSGEHIVRIDPDRAPELYLAVKKWRKRHGKPDKSSDYAHLCEAMSYLHYRLFPRVNHGALVDYKRITSRRRPSMLRGIM